MQKANKNITSNATEKPCYHPYLKKGKIPGEKVCTTCGRTVYLGQMSFSPASLSKVA